MGRLGKQGATAQRHRREQKDYKTRGFEHNGLESRQGTTLARGDRAPAGAILLQRGATGDPVRLHGNCKREGGKALNVLVEQGLGMYLGQQFCCARTELGFAVDEGRHLLAQGG